MLITFLLTLAVYHVDGPHQKVSITCASNLSRFVVNFGKMVKLKPKIRIFCQAVPLRAFVVHEKTRQIPIKNRVLITTAQLYQKQTAVLETNAVF